MSTIALLQRLYLKKKFSSFLQKFIRKKSLIAACYTLATELEIRTSTQKIFKNQTIDSFKLLLQPLPRAC